jgi:SAM-dependent methyltransferase
LHNSHWASFHRHWNRLKPPQRPHPDVAVALGKLIAEDGYPDRVLLLGVTPELAPLGRQLVAVDRNQAMIDHIWPGDGDGRQAIRGDWLTLPFPPASFAAVIGDGSCNCLAYPDAYRALFAEIARVTRPGGRIAIRVYLAPDLPETLPALRTEALSGRAGSFHAFKWRLAQALIAEAGDANVRVEAIREAFDREFPDRPGLARASGWSMDEIATIDFYKGSAEVYSFPTLAQFRAAMPGSFRVARPVSSGSYELAERCPLMVMDIPRDLP